MSVSFEYAKALFDLSLKEQQLNKTLGLFDESLLAFTKENMAFMNHPNVLKSDKKSIINKTYEDGLFKDFLYCLIDNNRFNLLKEIKDEFYILYIKYNKSKKVFVYSKESLSNSYLDKLKEKLEKRLDSKIEIELIIDNKIDGGIIIKYDSKEIDLTTTKRLNDLKESLKEEYV